MRIQYQHSASCQIRVAVETALHLKLVELLIVEAAKFRRQPAQRPDQPELRDDDVADETKPRLLRERETMLGFTLHLDERIARREKVRVQIGATVSRKGQVADPVCGLECADATDHGRRLTCFAQGRT